jgi:putative (di)nucleoside polyphosphate hydrolase
MNQESSAPEPTSDEVERRPYRQGVGLMIFNRQGRVFVGNRIDYPGENWQMPQGGIDAGESPRETAMRELEEEIGTAKAKIVAESRVRHCYDLPPEISRQAWRGRFRGQELHWFVLQFTGADRDIRLDKHKAEFNAWRWIDIDKLPTLIVPFKRAMYDRLVEEFRDIATR